MAQITARECVILTDDHLPHIGGSRIYCHRIASLLPGRLAVATRRRRGAREFDAGAPYPVTRAALRGGMLSGPDFVGEAVDAVALARAAGRVPGAKAYIAGEITPSAFAAAALSRRRGAAYGIIVHDEPFSGAGPLESAARRAVLAGAKALIATSGFPARRLRETLGEPAPLFYVPPGVDTDVFRPAAPGAETAPPFGLKPGRYVLSVGRLVPYKNFEAVLRAAASVDDHLRVAIVGEGPDRARLRVLQRDLGLEGRVVFAGRVARRDLVNLYRGALAYVFPSRRAAGRQHEGIGMAALEAAACGCPVAASVHTSATDFVEDAVTGLLFDPEEPGRLEEVLRCLVQSPRRRAALAAAGMERVHSRYTWRAAAHAFAEAVDHLVGD